MARLRIDTQSHHDAIEANPRLGRLMAADLDLGEYGAILRRLSIFHADVERRLRQWSGGFPEAVALHARLCKSALICRDLAAIGMPRAAPQVGLTCRWAPFQTMEAAWGCLYVVEGATLGGQIIVRQLNATLGVTPERGASFHAPYGPLTGARWRAFKAILTEEAARGALDEDAVVQGAKSAFAALDAWMAVEA